MTKWLAQSIRYTEPTQMRKAEVVNHWLMGFNRPEGSTAVGDLSGGHRVAQVLWLPTRGWGGGGELDVVTRRHPIPLVQGPHLFFSGWLRSRKRCKTRETSSYLLVSLDYCGHTAQKFVVGFHKGCGSEQLHHKHYAGLSPLLCSASRCVSLVFTDWWNHVSLNYCRMENLCIDLWQLQSVIKIQEQLSKA